MHGDGEFKSGMITCPKTNVKHMHVTKHTFYRLVRKKKLSRKIDSLSISSWIELM